MSTFANNNECLSSRRTSSNFLSNDGQSNVLSKNEMTLIVMKVKAIVKWSAVPKTPVGVITVFH